MEAATQTESTTFLERAVPYAKFGIPVFPLMPREKCPPASMTAWPELATTDLTQIADLERGESRLQLCIGGSSGATRLS